MVEKKVVLSIRGRKIRYEHCMIDINELRFYAKNPRVASILAEYDGGISDEFIHQKLWDKNTTHAIQQN